MGFLGKKLPKQGASQPVDAHTRGQHAEDQALHHALARGWQLIARNYRTPGRGGGEIDLILRTPEGKVVFAEVRSRSHAQFGGAGASIDAAKQRRIVLAARHWLQRQRSPPRCRFDAVLVQGGALQWIEGAFEAAS